MYDASWQYCISFVLGRTPKTYSYLVSEGISLVPFGKIEFPESNCQTTFKCLTYQSFISVASQTGVLSLTKNPCYIPKQANGIRKLTIKIRVTTACHKQHYVSVNLYVFPSNFGPAITILNSYTKQKIGGMVKQNKIFGTNRGMANSLHRIMRMTSESDNPTAHRSIMASVMVREAFEHVMKELMAEFVATIPGINPSVQFV